MIYMSGHFICIHNENKSLFLEGSFNYDLMCTYYELWIRLNGVQAMQKKHECLLWHPIYNKHLWNNTWYFDIVLCAHRMITDLDLHKWIAQWGGPMWTFNKKEYLHFDLL